MTYAQLEKFYGGFAEIVRATGWPKSTVHSWKRRNGLIPWPRQFDLESLTGGKLKADKRNGR